MEFMIQAENQTIQRDYNIKHEKLKLIEIAKRKFDVDYKIDKVNEYVIEKLLLYFSGNKKFETGKLSLGRGIMLLGGYGTGKSLLMKIFKHYCFEQKANKQFRVENVKGIVSKYQEFGINGIKNLTGNVVRNKITKKYHPIVLCLDDLGAEKQNASYFGSAEDVISELLYKRAEILQDIPGIFTHVTTNLDNQQLRERYPGRNHSRIVGMFNFFHLGGSDRR